MNQLFSQDKLNIINVGLKGFGQDAMSQGAVVKQVEWKPVAGGRKDIIEALDKVEPLAEKIKEANETVVSRMKAAKPVLVGMDLALNVVPEMTEHTILHAGPPIAWENMCGPMKGAVIGAVLFEGLAADDEEAVKLIESGAIKFDPCHEHKAVGPMAGVLSAHMPVHIVKNETNGDYAYCSINEGLGKVLRFGAYSKEVLDRLAFLRDEFMPVMQKALALTDGIDIKLITAQALQMGDECHNRNKAATSLFYKQISQLILETDCEKAAIQKTLSFIAGNDHYFLNLSMPACKLITEAGQNVPYATIVSTMARNGVEFGIKVSGIGTGEWFDYASNYIEGLYFPGYSKEDANPDIGDSAITETTGIGGMSMAGAPAIVQFVGGDVEDAFNTTKRMYGITTDINAAYAIPNMNFKGAPMGIDMLKVIESGVLPVINTGIAHKEAGIGQIGAGIVNPPMECFYQALLAYVKKYA
ncbi:DUF1116 domain-containing protein [Lacrimispora defluvii]|uniref:DUF1116 domain-containing protein n=1 Tax=Lacrimispora defluvii TaxID=2719233 RepID=A0ABX1VUT1_9FIRM|nr:DUF1116 domain-containing protein [Lacrimispora defluvii]NNJ32111.1 DUF1116 domain-containing protein [Lacrimispora defluvii]